jgi:hypothetical protein
MKRTKHYDYDVALSFAGEDRRYAEELAEVLVKRNVQVFYDRYEKVTLWGKDLYIYFSDLYQNRAHYCVMFISRHYAENLWTRHERSSAQVRAFKESEEYILPVRLDDTIIPGLSPNVAYLSWPPEDAKTIANTIEQKLGREPYVAPPQSAVRTATHNQDSKTKEITEDEAMHNYLKKIEAAYEAGNATELTYRLALEELLSKLETGITITHEPAREEYGAPDYVISRSTGHGLLKVGYIEAKDLDINLDVIEKDAQREEPKTREGEQLKRYRQALDNLVLTNYLEFRWYLHGEHRITARLTSPIIDKGLTVKKKGSKREIAGTDFTQLMIGIHAQNTTHVARLLAGFLTHSTEPISSPKDLAVRMARIAHIIRDMTVVAFQQGEASNTLNDLYEGCKQVLIPDLTIPQFSDMFAQTLAYGLFAARYNHTGTAPFRRQDAAREISNTNPFLAGIFERITGRDLDKVPFAKFVDDLAQLLAQTDMNTVLADFGKRTRQQDPLIHFYETFLSEYDHRLRELRGVYFTPEPVVSFIVRSVDNLLKECFQRPDGLADISKTTYLHDDGYSHKSARPSSRVLILDPACGTGTFLYAVINLIRERYDVARNAGMWSTYVREYLLTRIYGFELLMAPYAMAHLKLAMQLAALDLPESQRSKWAYNFEGDERLGLYLTNTLEEATKHSEMLFARYISDEANAASEIKRDLPIMAIMGNPPYSGHSANRSWVIKDGKKVSTFIGKLLKDYHRVDGHPLRERNSKWLQDDYVKFIRFGQWRIERAGEGILAYITNHSYLDNPTFRGMRQSLIQSFDYIYVLDLHGSSQKEEQPPDGIKDENVFDIKQGVAISIFVRGSEKKNGSRHATVYYAQLWGTRAYKYQWLTDNLIEPTRLTDGNWAELHPQSPFYFFVPQANNLREEYARGKKITEIMPVNVMGFQSHRDHFAVDFDRDKLFQRISEMHEKQLSVEKDQEFAAEYKLPSADWVATARQRLRADEDWQKHFIHCLFRPFDWRYCYFSNVVMDRPRKELLDHVAGKENICLLLSRQQATLGYHHAWVARDVANDCVISTKSREANQVFPLYLYTSIPKKGLFALDEYALAEGDRVPNIAVEVISILKEKLGMEFISDGRGDLHQKFGPEDIFDYIYAILHSPTYRERYAEFLKSDFPYIPFTSNADLFRALCSLGSKLLALHLMEQFGHANPAFPAAGDNVVEQVVYTFPVDQPEQGRVSINKAQYFDGVSPSVWEFLVGGHQVCDKWLKERKGRVLSYEEILQYQRIIAALEDTITSMEQIDEEIGEQGGWPIA